MRPADSFLSKHCILSQAKCDRSVASGIQPGRFEVGSQELIYVKLASIHFARKYLIAWRTALREL